MRQAVCTSGNQQATRMSGSSEDLRRHLLSQLRALRGRIDKRVLNHVLTKVDGWEPYDQESAGEAVRQFLATRQDGGKFQDRLRGAMAKKKDSD
ncbi:hypothetical protein HBA54_14695 [Pelagibius litoralis]|uniref:Uncharacterized protein n=1 Tax=Pelagibius litoralis TaxID=374515 RepID=A0A967EYN1_9PROT|nr:hypothetical protein [Pelagibius litoralis]NIA69850.1 hypothetical protein [Pelagibius litoralis]